MDIIYCNDEIIKSKKLAYLNSWFVVEQNIKQERFI